MLLFLGETFGDDLGEAFGEVLGDMRGDEARGDLGDLEPDRSSLWAKSAGLLGRGGGVMSEKVWLLLVVLVLSLLEFPASAWFSTAASVCVESTEDIE